MTQIALLAGGLGALGWAGADARFRDAEGYLDTPVCLPAAAGLALLFVGAASAGRARRLLRPALWLAAACVGQAVHLQMIEAGTNVSFQHYRSVRTLLTEYRPYVGALAGLHAVIVLAGAVRLFPAMRTWVWQHARSWRVVCIGLAFILPTAAKINQPLGAFVAELALASFLQTVSLLNILLVCVSIPEDVAAAWAERVRRWASGARPRSVPAARLDAVAIAAAAWVTGVAYLLCVLAYERHPHIPDEVVYLTHARYFAEGRLSLPAPPDAEGFELDLMDLRNGRWYSPVPPGWPAVLSVGVLLGEPWLVNPVLGGLTVLAAYGLLREVYDRRTARAGVMLMACSPWFLFTSMSLMTHALTLASGVAAGLGVARARRTGRSAWALLGGAALGLVGLIRPLEGLVLAGLLGLWALGAGGTRLRPRATVALVLGALCVGSVVLPYNRYFTGQYFKFPINDYVDHKYGPGKNSLGFGPDKGLGWVGVDPYPGHGIKDAILNTNLNAFSVNTDLFGWSTGCVLPIALAVFAGGLTRADRCMAAAILAIVGIHAFYWYSGGPDLGARYWYLILVPCIALTVRGLDMLARSAVRGGLAAAPARVTGGVAMLCALSIAIYVPWRAVDRYHHFRRLRPDIRVLAERHKFGRSLVLIRGNNHDDYVAAAVYNPLDLFSDATVYAWDKNPEVRSRLLALYADRPVWIVNGTTLTGGAFKVIAGPLPAEQLRAADKSGLATRVGSNG